MHRRSAATVLALALVVLATGGEAMAFRLESSAFEGNGAIPRRHTCQGDDISPPLSWSGIPAGTKSLALCYGVPP